MLIGLKGYRTGKDIWINSDKIRYVVDYQAPEAMKKTGSYSEPGSSIFLEEQEVQQVRELPEDIAYFVHTAERKVHVQPT